MRHPRNFNFLLIQMSLHHRIHGNNYLVNFSDAQSVTKAFSLSNVLQLFKYLIICLLLAEDKLI